MDTPLKDQFIVLIDSGIFAGHAEIVRQRIGAEAFDEAVHMLSFHRISAMSRMELVVMPLLQQTREAIGEGKRMASLIGCPYLSNPFVQYLGKEQVPAESVFICSSNDFEFDLVHSDVASDMARDAGNYLVDVDEGWEEYDKDGHTPISRLIETQILKIRPHLKPAKLDESAARAAYSRGLRKCSMKHTSEIYKYGLRGDFGI